MRHRRNTTKLKRTAAHRRSLLANLAGSLIEHGRIKTTLGKAKALRPVAEKLVTLAKRDDLHSRRLAIAFLYEKDLVKKLFAEVAPASKDRQGGYTRITKLGVRPTDAAPMAIIEWVDQAAQAEVAPVEVVEEAAPAPKAKKAAKKKAAPAEEAAEG
ncbi:MAG TPA: 50S ribosomal protein L17 [Luteolibacter sp.]|jgi:large subunit ribosomal protein L17|nr:50S ribosomal protein L17 [Luteolibacter sp.]